MSQKTSPLILYIYDIVVSLQYSDVKFTHDSVHQKYKNRFIFPELKYVCATVAARRVYFVLIILR